MHENYFIHDLNASNNSQISIPISPPLTDPFLKQEADIFFSIPRGNQVCSDPIRGTGTKMNATGRCGISRDRCLDAQLRSTPTPPHTTVTSLEQAAEFWACKPARGELNRIWYRRVPRSSISSDALGDPVHTQPESAGDESGSCAGVIRVGSTSDPRIKNPWFLAEPRARFFCCRYKIFRSAPRSVRK